MLVNTWTKVNQWNLIVKSYKKFSTLKNMFENILYMCKGQYNNSTLLDKYRQQQWIVCLDRQKQSCKFNESNQNFKIFFHMGSYDDAKNNIILCIWCNAMFMRFNTVHYCCSFLPCLSETCWFLQSSSFWEVCSDWPAIQCVVIGRIPQACGWNVMPLTIFGIFLLILYEHSL